MPKWALRHSSGLLALLYGAFGVLWIVVSDSAVRGVAADTDALTRYQTGKGWFFVAISTVLVYALLRVAQRRLHRALRLAEQVATVAVTAPGVMFTLRLDADGRCALPFVSPAIETLTGLTAGAVAGDARRLADCLPPDDLERLRAALATSAAARAPLHEQVRLSCPAGERWVEVRATPVPHEAGAVLWHGMLTDVTTRRTADAALADAAARYASLVENSPDAIFVNRDDRVALVNPACVALLGADGPDALLGRPIHELFLQADRQQISERISAMRVSGRAAPAAEERIQRLDGTSRLVEVLASPFTFDGRTCIHVMLRDVTARREAQVALRESEQRLRLALESTATGVWSRDLKTNTLDWDAQTRTIMGFGDRTPTFDELQALIHPDDRAVTQDALRHAIETRTLYDRPMRIVRADGEVRWIAVYGRAEYDPDGRPERMRGTVRDVTARRATQKALHETEQRWQFAVEGSDLGVWDWNVQTGEVHLSPRWKSMLGYSESEIGDHISEWVSRVHPDDMARAEAALERHFAGETPYYANEHRMRRKDGTWCWILDRGKVLERDAQGRPLRAFGTHTDITERKLAEQALRDAETRWEFAVEGSDQGLWDWNLATDRIFHSARCMKLIHRGDQSCIVSSAEFRHWIHPDDVPGMDAAFQAHARGETPSYSHELRLVGQEGAVVWMQSRGRIIERDARGAPLRAIGTVADITARKAAEQARRDAETRWQFAIEGSELGLWDWNLVTGEVFRSPRMRSMLGYTEAEFGDRLEDWEALVHPEDRAGVDAALKRHLADETPFFEVEHRLRRRDGGWCWVLSRGRVMERADDGTPLRCIGTHADISARRAMEEALRESEARANLIFETAPEAMLLVAADGRVVRGNARAAELFGHAPAALAGVPLDALVSATTDQARLRLHDALFVDEQGRFFGEDLGLWGRDAAGRSFPAELSVGPVEFGWQRHAIVSVTDISARLQAAATLRDSEDLLSTMLDSLPSALAVLDARGVILRVNRAWAEFARSHGGDEHLANGVGIDYLGVMDGAARMDDSDASTAYAGMLAVQRGERSVFTMEYPCGCIDDDHWFVLQVVPLGRERRGLVVVHTDVTERKRAELALAESEQLLGHAQAMARVGGWTADLRAGTFTCGAVTMDLFGFESPTFPASRVLEAVYPDDRARVRAAWRAAVAGARPYDIEHRVVVGGRVMWVHAKCTMEPDADGRPARAVGMTQDVTEVREAQLALEAHRERLEELVAERTADARQQATYLHALIDNFPFMVWLKDPQQHYLAANRATAIASGRAVQDIIGRSDETLWAPTVAEHFREIDATVMSTRAPLITEEQGPAQGGRAWLESYVAPVLDEQGRLLGTVGFARDISERKAAEFAREQALTEAERLARVRSEFLANMSHEIRTPLNAVLGLAEVGAKQSRSRRSFDLFTRIVDSGRHLLGVVDDILDFSKIEAGKFTLEDAPYEPVAAIDQATGLIAPRAAARGLEFRVIESPDLPARCRGDMLRVSQVLVNLLSNAVKFTAAGGRIELVALREDDTLVLRVRDTGVGMTPEHVARLFRPFEQADGSTTRKFGGTGLGLSISKHLVDLMGGTIAVDSEPGRGTCFDVRLPLRDPVAAEPWTPRGPVALLGATPVEAQGWADALRPWGVAIAPDARAPFVLAAVEGLAVPAVRAAVDAALAAGSQVVVLVPPGVEPTLQALEGRVNVLERPLRVPHLATLPVLGAGDPPAAPPGVERLAGVRILAAEDNAANRLVLEELLRAEGARLTCVENGERLLAQVRERGEAAWDIVITDVQMPVMDGYETARALREIAPDLPVVGLTAHAMPEERARCLAAGMRERVVKPASGDMLVDVVLRHRRGAEPAPAVDAATAPRVAVVARLRSPAVAIDWAAVESHYRGRAGFVDRLAKTILDSHAGTAASLSRAADAGDLETVASIAHAVKGVCGTVLAEAVETLAARAERAARDRDAQALTLARALASAVDSLCAVMAARVRGAVGDPQRREGP